MHSACLIRRSIFILVLSAYISSSLSAQESLRILSLEDAIKTGLESSVEIQRYKELLERDQQYVMATRASLRSNANFQFQVPSFDQSVEGIKDILGVTHYVYTSNTKWRSLLNVNQPLATNGNLSVNYDFFYHIQQSQLNNYSNYLFLKFEQPIFTPNTLSMGIRRAEIGYQRTELEYTNRRLNHVYNISRDYYQTVESILHVGTYERSVSRLRDAYQISRNLFSEGKLEETDVLQLEIELSRSRDNVLSNQSAQERQLSSFKQLIGLPEEEPIMVDTTLEYNSVNLQEEKIVQEGLKRNTTLKLNEISLEETEMLKVDAYRESEFKGSIVATYGLDKKDPAFQESYRNFDKAQSLLMQFYVPVWDWGRNKARVAAAEAQIRTSEIRIEETEKDVIRGLRNRVNELRNNIRRLDILAKSRQSAERNFTLSLEQFKNNRIKSQELILTQNQLLESDLSYLNAYTDYRTAMADLLRRISGAEPW